MPLLGMGLATRFFTTNALKITDGCLPKVKLVHAGVGITLIVIFDLFVIPPFTVAPSLYYVFQFVKYTIPPILIITDIPFITGLAKVRYDFVNNLDILDLIFQKNISSDNSVFVKVL